ncbi:unnamed protein product, partial [Mycena citricolor]
VSMLVSTSCRFVVRRRVNTACERDEVSFMLVAATLGQIFDVWPKTGMFANTQITRVLGIQQIPDLLVVDLGGDTSTVKFTFGSSAFF